MNNDAKFLPFEESDLQTVVAIEQRVMPFGWNINTFRPCLRNNAYECWKLQSREGFIGYCILYYVGASAQLLNLCVDLPYQGQGFGRDLLRFAVVRSKEKEAREIYLEVRVSNVVARQLYHSMGFRKIDQRKDYYESALGREHADVYSLKLI